MQTLTFSLFLFLYHAPVEFMEERFIIVQSGMTGAECVQMIESLSALAFIGSLSCEAVFAGAGQ